jgi:predicted small metal-binding protein
MAKEVTCPPCGEVLRGENDDELVSAVIGHAKSHGHEVGETERDQILSEAREV